MPVPHARNGTDVVVYPDPQKLAAVGAGDVHSIVRTAQRSSSTTSARSALTLLRRSTGCRKGRLPRTR